MRGATGFLFHQIRSKQLGKSLTDKIRFGTATLIGVFESLIALKTIKPDVVIGLGGYASAAPIIAAKLLSIPSVLLEQNVIPGKANRLLAKWVDEVYCHWRGSLKWFSHAKVVRVTGTPIRKEIVQGQRRAPPKIRSQSFQKDDTDYGRESGRPVDQRGYYKCLPKMESLAGELQIIHITGEYSYEMVKEAYSKTAIGAHVCSFLDDMGAAFSMADVIICRAGATTIAEITALGIPAILIPYPYAADNHQYWNAMELAGNGGATHTTA